MADWNKLIIEADSLDYWPEPAVAHLITEVRKTFGEAGTKIWDLGCGRGRHCIALASQGIEVYGSDSSQNALDITSQLLKKYNLSACLSCSDMQNYPFRNEIDFNAILCWNVLQHNTFDKIKKTVKLMKNHLCSGGFVMLSVCSERSPGYGKGECIEPGGYIAHAGREKGVLHHYFSKEELLDLFDEKCWSLTVLAENIVLYHSLDDCFSQPNVFRSTGWLIIAKRK